MTEAAKHTADKLYKTLAEMRSERDRLQIRAKNYAKFSNEWRTRFEAQERLIETQEAALRAASNELSRLLFNEPSQTTHKVIEVVDAALASTNGKHRNPS